ncbi:MAG TPA: cytochrome P450, partial [Ramlibacter sp.]|nr:cytochrome P450 [Ramlibacter sp.]
MGAIPRIQDFADPSYDPFVSDEAAFGNCEDPYPQLAAWRAQGPVHKMDYRSAMGLYPDVTMADLEHYLVLGYEAVEKIFLDPVTYSNKTYARNLGISFGRSVSTMDAPEHARFRKIFQKAFLPNVVAKWGDTLVDPVVHALMDQFIGRGKADLVQEFTHHYP